MKWKWGQTTYRKHSKNMVCPLFITENTSSEVESLELYLPEGKTYNLTVDVGHTFYVGELKT